MSTRIDYVIKGELLDYKINQGEIREEGIEVYYSDMSSTAYISQGENHISFTEEQFRELAKILKDFL